MQTIADMNSDGERGHVGAHEQGFEASGDGVAMSPAPVIGRAALEYIEIAFEEAAP